MAQTSFFADTAVIQLAATSAATTVPAISVGVMKGVDIQAEFEFVELHGQDSIEMEDVARKTLRVPFTASTAKFHPVLLARLMGTGVGANQTGTADTDRFGDTSSGRTEGTITDSNLVPRFNIDAVVTGKNGETLAVNIVDAYFENIPFPIPEGEFMVLELTGVGRTMTIDFVTT